MGQIALTNEDAEKAVIRWFVLIHGAQPSWIGVKMIDQEIMFTINEAFRKNDTDGKWLSLHRLYSILKGIHSMPQIRKSLARLHAGRKIEVNDWKVRPTNFVAGFAHTWIDENRIYEMLKLHGGLKTSEAPKAFQDMFGPCNAESLQRTMRRLAERKKLLRKNSKYYLYKLKEFTQTRLRTI